MTVLFVAVVATLAAAGGVAFAQAGDNGEPAQPVAIDAAAPPWRDLERAQQGLELAISGRDTAQRAIDRTINGLQVELARLDQLKNTDSGQRLLMEEAEKLVVQEYMAGGEAEDVVFVLGVAEATDALWRKALLSEVSELIDEAIDAVDNVPGERERTEARIRRLDDAIPYLSSRVIEAQESIEAAEWVVYIAEINDLAERERVKNGFIEPTAQHWHNLRFCESTNNYTAESANGRGLPV